MLIFGFVVCADAEELSKSVSQIRVPLGGDSISQQYLAMRRYHKKHGVVGSDGHYITLVKL